MTHYDVLGVAPGAPSAEVRQAYVALARVHHPDRAGGDAVRMQAINAAWATLGDPERRARYDADVLHAAPSPPPPGPSWGHGGTEVDGLDDDLEDDRPIGGQVVLPRWVSMIPVGTFAASVVLFVGSLLMASPAGVGAAVALFVLSCTLFLAAPFIALLASRRTG